MRYIYTRELKYELLEVEQLFRTGLAPWSLEVDRYLVRLNNDSTWQHLPGMVLSAYHFMGLDKSFSIAMANIFKNLYFAQSIHSWVRDDEEGQEYNRDLQFSILIGDYIFGHVLKLLVNIQATILLQDFLPMICTIHEGSVLKHKFAISEIGVLQKTRVPLYSTAFITAGKLARLSPERLKIYGRLGYNMGMAIELLENNHDQEADQYIHDSISLYEEFSQVQMIGPAILDRAVAEIHDIISRLNQVAVI